MDSPDLGFLYNICGDRFKVAVPAMCYCHIQQHQHSQSQQQLDKSCIPKGDPQLQLFLLLFKTPLSCYFFQMTSLVCFVY